MPFSLLSSNIINAFLLVWGEQAAQPQGSVEVVSTQATELTQRKQVVGVVLGDGSGLEGGPFTQQPVDCDPPVLTEQLLPPFWEVQITEGISAVQVPALG